MNAHLEISGRIRDLMEVEGTNWIQPWTQQGMPRNPLSGTVYRGVNIVLLGLAAMQENFGSNCWATYKQWATAGAQVRKGQHGTAGYFYTAVPSKEDPDKRVPIMRKFVVFNVDQVDGWVMAPMTNRIEFVDAAEDLVKLNQPTLQFGGMRAFYRPSSDTIHMPPHHDFVSQQGYYSTLFHELTHWTGHASRLDRLKKTAGKDEDYAWEELVAELGAAFLCCELGITAEPRPDHAQYLNAWIQGLKHKPYAFSSATTAASRAVRFLHHEEETTA